MIMNFILILKEEIISLKGNEKEKVNIKIVKKFMQKNKKHLYFLFTEEKI